VFNLVAGAGAVGANETFAPHASDAGSVARGSVETVYFSDRRQAPVRIVRGAGSAGGPHARHEILTFDGGVRRVAVIRGLAEPVSIPGAPSAGNAGSSPQMTTKRVDPLGPTRSGLTLLRGGAPTRGESPVDLFRLADNEEFYRIAEAVHAVESRYGTDLRMWRLGDLNGPQGPMQVSAAAAIDVGGGNRFDVYENMLLGRAYLARMFRRYGIWSDALAAYNWGPGNVDQWIVRGRQAAQLPAETTRYIERVLQLAVAGPTAGTARQRGSKR
jgi:hypothetical protein